MLETIIAKTESFIRIRDNRKRLPAAQRHIMDLEYSEARLSLDKDFTNYIISKVESRIKDSKPAPKPDKPQPAPKPVPASKPQSAAEFDNKNKGGK